MQRFALSGDGRHKWRPYTAADGENYHADDGKTGHNACRTTTKTVERKRRGAIYDSRTPERRNDERRNDRGHHRSIPFACGYARQGDGRQKWRPNM